MSIPSDDELARARVAQAPGDLDISKPDAEAADEASKRFRALALVRAVTAFTAMGEGYDIGIINVILVDVTQQFSLLPREVGMLGGALHAMAGFGALFAGWFADVFGRKLTLSLVYALLALGAVVMCSAVVFETVLVGRGIMGIALGAGTVTVALLMGEVSPARIRGFMLMIESLMISVGIVIALCLGLFLSFTRYSTDWRVLVALAAVLPVLCALAIWCTHFPESPRWLLRQGRTVEAYQVMERLCDESEVAECMRSARGGQQEASWYEVLFPSKPTQQQALLAGLGVALLKLSSGVTIIMVYSSQILERETSKSAAVFGSLAFGITKLCTTGVAAMIVDNVGRRTLILLSCCCMALSLGACGYAFMVRAGVVTKAVLFCCIMVSYNLGLGSAADAVMTEVFSNRRRAKATSLMIAISRWMGCLVSTSFPLLDAWLGTANVFYLFAAMNALGAGLAFLTVPETAQCTLEEMHLVFATPPYTPMARSPRSASPARSSRGTPRDRSPAGKPAQVV